MGDREERDKSRDRSQGLERGRERERKRRGGGERGEGGQREEWRNHSRESDHAWCEPRERQREHEEQQGQQTNSRDSGRERALPDLPLGTDKRLEEKLRRIEERRRTERESEELYGREFYRDSGGNHHRSQLEPDPQEQSQTGGQRRAPVETRWDDPARYFLSSLQRTRSRHRAPPNRFNIAPGPAWDGIDRSNGYERKFLQAQAQKEALKEQAYRHDYQDL